MENWSGSKGVRSRHKIIRQGSQAEKEGAELAGRDFIIPVAALTEKVALRLMLYRE